MFCYVESWVSVLPLQVSQWFLLHGVVDSGVPHTPSPLRGQTRFTVCPIRLTAPQAARPERGRRRLWYAMIVVTGVVGMQTDPESTPPFGGVPYRTNQRGCPPPFQVGLKFESAIGMAPNSPRLSARKNFKFHLACCQMKHFASRRMARYHKATRWRTQI